MSTATLPDLEIIDDLDFNPAIPCECEGLHPEHGTGNAVWRIRAGCPKCSSHRHVVACDGCWKYYQTWERLYHCPECLHVGPAYEFARLIGPI